MNGIALRSIEDHEGTVMINGRHVMYRCSAGHNSIGYGCNLDAGWPDDLAKLVMHWYAMRAEAELEITIGPAWHRFSARQQAALIDMMYCLGGPTFRTRRKFITATKAGDISGMVRELRNSRWYGQAKGRVDDLVELLQKPQ